MKKIKYILLTLTIILLVGCQNNDIDYDQLYEEYYADIEYVNSDNIVDICEGIEEGMKTDIEVDYIYRYENLGEMIEDENAKFVYGEIYKVEYYNCVVNSAYFMVYDSEFKNESRQLIRISITDDVVLNTNKQYILSLGYEEDNDYYYLSQQSHSIIFVDSAETLSGLFLTDDYPKNLKGFLGEVFNKE